LRSPENGVMGRYVGMMRETIAEGKIVFTRHAKNRMRWRKVPKARILETLKAPIAVQKEGENLIFWGYSEEKGFLKVVCRREEDVLLVITVVTRRKLPEEVVQ